MKNPFFISDSKYADELIKLDFPEGLYTSPQDCKNYLDHCNTYNMKFLKHSYGTLVHKDFDKYFEYIPARNDEQYEIQQQITCKKGLDGNYTVDGVNLDLDHTNLLRSKQYPNVYIVTSSPYGSLDKNTINNLENYPHNWYILNPNFLDYHGFIGRLGKVRPPLWDMNFAYTTATEEEIYEITKLILHKSDLFLAFGRL